MMYAVAAAMKMMNTCIDELHIADANVIQMSTAPVSARCTAQ